MEELWPHQKGKCILSVRFYQWAVRWTILIEQRKTIYMPK